MRSLPGWSLREIPLLFGSGKSGTPWARMHTEKATNDCESDEVAGRLPDEPHAAIAIAPLATAASVTRKLLRGRFTTGVAAPSVSDAQR